MRMNYGVLEPQTPVPDNQWWKTGRSLGEIADRLEHALAEKEKLERRVAELLAENERLAADVRAQKLTAGGRQQAVFAARERLVKDEFERKLQALQLELNKERHRHARELKQIEMDRAGCICKSVRIDHVDSRDAFLADLPAGWKIGNAK